MVSTSILNLIVGDNSFNLIRNSFRHILDSGVYRIPCSGCDSSYIGESTDIGRRLKQHKTDIKNANYNNSIMKHIAETGHPVPIDNASVIIKINNVNRRKLFESIIIKNTKNINAYQTSVQLDKFTISLLNTYVPNLRKLIVDLDTGQP